MWLASLRFTSLNFDSHMLIGALHGQGSLCLIKLSGTLCISAVSSLLSVHHFYFFLLCKFAWLVYIVNPKMTEM